MSNREQAGFALSGLVAQVRQSVTRYSRSALFRRSARNSFYNTADYALLPFLWILSAPIFTKKLGVDQYGVWMLTNTIMGFGGAMAFGLSDATIKFVAQYRAANNLKVIQTVIRTSLTLYTLLGAVAAIAIGASSGWLVAHVFHVEPANRKLAVFAITMGGIGLLVRFLDSVFLSALQGFERYDTNARVSMVVNVITIGANVASVLTGHGLRNILTTIVAMQLAGAIVKGFLLKPLLREHWNLWPLFQKSALREISGFGFYSWIQTLGGIFLQQADRFLIASLLNTEALGYYALCVQLTQQIQALLSKAMAFLFPFASVARQEGDTSKLRSYYFKGLIITIVAAVSMGLPIFLLSHAILSLWMGPAFAAKTAGVLRLLIVSVTFWSTSIVPYYYMNGVGFVRMNAASSVLSGLMVVAASLLLIGPYGLMGAALARLATLPVAIVARTILHHRVLQDTRWYGGVITLLPVAACYVAAFLLLAGVGDHIQGVVALLPAAAAYCVLGLVLGALSVRLFPLVPSGTPS